MDSETLERIKQQAQMSSEPLVEDTLDLVAEVQRLRKAVSLSGVADTMAKYVAEIEKLEAINAELLKACMAALEALEFIDGGQETDAYDYCYDVIKKAKNIDDGGAWIDLIKRIRDQDNRQ